VAAPRAIDDYATLVRPFAPGVPHEGWLLVAVEAAAPDEGLATLRFAPAPGGPGAPVAVTLAPRTTGRPSYARTARYDVYYRGQAKGAAAQAAVGRLLAVVTRLIKASEG
jgi:hypothetical protein